MRIALVILALGILVSVLFFSFANERPEGISAAQRFQCERIIDLTRREMSILQLEVDLINQRIDAGRAVEGDQAEVVKLHMRLTRSEIGIIKLEEALEKDSPAEMEAAASRLESKE